MDARNINCLEFYPSLEAELIDDYKSPLSLGQGEGSVESRLTIIFSRIFRFNQEP